ncbi:uncharacterized protein si:ch211-102c2.4 [Toxotes jaculatrix]|uniref:uncharacterized protein si:ch211-102c2.4 n=1 Tax=Toxotes jaculatrix TaxID=941984 RepID=UPI001B3ABB1D|nr:uncharacterized protein si:ch211-102c2.4 [Toxotes jaculatrix]
MHLITLVLLLALGACEAVYWQKLTCPYEPEHKSLRRVWCRHSTTECCTGLIFSQSDHLVDGGKLRVTQDLNVFTVAVMEPSQGEGVYWCGVLNRNDTLIKLAESYIYSSSIAYFWSYIRWILLAVLPIVTIFTSVSIRQTTKHSCKKAEEPHGDIAVSRTLTDLQYENVASSCELEQ